MKELYYAIRRFFIIGTGGYTRYSDYPGFEEQFQIELKKIRAKRRARLVVGLEQHGGEDEVV